jgi:hypothetical protein
MANFLLPTSIYSMMPDQQGPLISPDSINKEKTQELIQLLNLQNKPVETSKVNRAPAMTQEEEQEQEKYLSTALPAAISDIAPSDTSKLIKQLTAQYSGLSNEPINNKGMIQQVKDIQSALYPETELESAQKKALLTGAGSQGFAGMDLSPLMAWGSQITGKNLMAGYQRPKSEAERVGELLKQEQADQEQKRKEIKDIISSKLTAGADKQKNLLTTIGLLKGIEASDRATLKMKMDQQRFNSYLIRGQGNQIIYVLDKAITNDPILKETTLALSKVADLENSANYNGLKNPFSANIAKNKMIRGLMGEVGALNEGDIARASGDPSWASQVIRKWDNISSNPNTVFSDEDIADIVYAVELQKEILMKKYQQRVEPAARKASYLLGKSKIYMTPEEIKQVMQTGDFLTSMTKPMQLNIKSGDTKAAGQPPISAKKQAALIP